MLFVGRLFRLIVFCSMTLLVFACGTADDDGGPAGATDTTGTTDPTGTGAEYTLDSCTTTIADDVPSFFKTYFKCVDISMNGDNVVIATRSLPPHKSAYYGEGHVNYEVFDTSRGADYELNPNSIAEQNITVEFPTNPTSQGLTINAALVDGQVGSSNDEYGMGPVGVALDSVSIFNPLAAPGEDIEDEKYNFDIYNGHPEPRGAYHYHTTSSGPLEVLEKLGLVTVTSPGDGQIELYGVMCDGTVVMGCRELDGSRPDTGGFDSQGGHVHDMVDGDGTTQLSNRYHTHICPGGTGFSHDYTPEIQYYNSCEITGGANNPF